MQVSRPRISSTIPLLAAYVVLWLAADFYSKIYAEGSGLSVWDIRAALDVVLFLRLGWLWWPLPVALTAIRLLVAPAGFKAGLGVNVAASVPYELVYALAVLSVQHLGARFQLRTLRDVLVFLAILVVPAPVISNGVLLLVASAFGIHIDIVTQMLRGAIADATSIIVIVPLLTLMLSWGEPLLADEPAAQRRVDYRIAVRLLILVIVVVVEYLLVKPSGLPLIEFSIVPLAWIAITDGIRGAAIAVLVCDIAVTIMHVALGIPVRSQLEYEGYLIATALVALLVGVISSERTAFAERLRKSAFYDAVTALPNSLSFESSISQQSGRPLSLLLLDVSDVRLIGEAIGRAPSDDLLRDFAQRLQAMIPSGAVLARTDYDEFAIALPETQDPHQLVDAVKGMNGAAFPVGDSNVYIDTTLGAAGIAAVDSVSGALHRARVALRGARQSVDRLNVLLPGTEHDVAEPPVVDLYRAVERGEFTQFYQPIYRFDRDSERWNLTGAEALLRWRHPERGLLRPAKFLHLLNRFSVGTQVGWDVLERSLRDAVRWRRAIPGIRVWVNLSSRQALDPQSPGTIAGLIERAGAAADMLAVEITEQLVSGFDVEIAAFARSMRALGVVVAIDDFGTGTSSLSRLREVPADILKIDRSFVTQSDFDEKARAVARTIVRLAGELGVEALAEGVETQAQTAAMIDAGCRFAQGYAFAHPMPADIFERDYLAPRPSG